VNQAGEHPAFGEQEHLDGGPADCAEACRRRRGCSGYVALAPRGCQLLAAGFSPSSGDGTGVGQCFWRHVFKRDSGARATAKPLPIPNIIWTFWSDPPESGPFKDYWYNSWASLALHRLLNAGAKVVEGVRRSMAIFAQAQSHQPGAACKGKARGPPPFVELCLATWRKLNPDFQVRILTRATLWDWLSPADLPLQYENLDIQHQADSIRLALLIKYGGVWLDASVLLLRPLGELLAGPRRPFFTTDNRRPHLLERRVDRDYFVENWFLAAPPHDPLLEQTGKCLWKFFEKGGYDVSSPWGRDLRSSGLFSPRQLELIDALGINSYFVMYGCLYRSIDEDRGLWRWWKGGSVRHLNSWDSAFTLFKNGWFEYSWYPGFMNVVDGELFANLTAPSSFMIKFPGAQRDAMIGLSHQELFGGNGTLRKLLGKLGVKKEDVSSDDCW